jgi:hypothetical protein
MADQGRVLPLKTETAAYQGNSTIKVWVSFDPSSLRLNLNGDVIAGSYGLVEGDDPLDINNTLEKFDYSFGTGGVVGFKLRLINPSARLEAELTKIYKTLYEKGDPAREYSNSYAPTQDEFTPPDQRMSLLEENEVPPFPSFYIRWGYGTKKEDGISSIHTAKLVDIKYRLNAKRERIAELTLMDPFSFAGESTLNPLAQEGLSADTFLFDQVTGSLKLPSRIIGELISDFGESFPEIFIYSDLDGGDVGKALDASLYEILTAISEYDGDVLLKLQRGESLEDPIVTESFSEEERAAIENAIEVQQDPKQFLESLPSQYRANNIGVVVLAYKILFTRLGFNLLYQRVTDEPEFSDQPREVQHTRTSSSEEDERESANEDLYKKRKVWNTEAYIAVQDRSEDKGNRYSRPATREEITEIQTQFPDVTYDSLPVSVTIGDPQEELRRAQGPIEQNPVLTLVRYKGTTLSAPGVFIKLKDENGNVSYSKTFGLVKNQIYTRANLAELTEKGFRDLVKDLSEYYKYVLEEDMSPQQFLESVLPLPEDSEILKRDKSIYKIIYDSDQQETVLQGLQKVLTNINTLLSDRIKKVWYSYIDFNNLNEDTYATIATGDLVAAGKDPIAFYFNKLGVPREEFKNSVGMVVISDEASSVRKGLTGGSKRVLSFPEITTEGAFSQGADSSRDITSKDVIYLDVAAKDSVVVDLSFTGEQRVLASLARVPYMTRQSKQFQDLFVSPSESYDVLNFLLDQALEEQGEVEDKKRSKQAAQGGLRESSKEIYDEEIQNLLIPYLRVLLKDSTKLPALRKYFTIRGQAQGRKSSSDKLDEDFISNLLSILESKTLLDKLFPLNKKSIRSYYKLDGTTVVRETDPLKLTREIKIFEGFSKNRNPLDSFIKDTVIAAQNLSNEAWKVDVVTLGIPELDLPPQELGSRIVVLNVWDERTQSLHWLSGVYELIGIAHAIDPSRGYLTKLKLIKGLL